MILDRSMLVANGHALLSCYQHTDHHSTRLCLLLLPAYLLLSFLSRLLLLLSTSKVVVVLVIARGVRTRMTFGTHSSRQTRWDQPACGSTDQMNPTASRESGTLNQAKCRGYHAHAHLSTLSRLHALPVDSDDSGSKAVHRTYAHTHPTKGRHSASKGAHKSTQERARKRSRTRGANTTTIKSVGNAIAFLFRLPAVIHGAVRWAPLPLSVSPLSLGGPSFEDSDATCSCSG